MEIYHGITLRAALIATGAVAVVTLVSLISVTAAVLLASALAAGGAIARVLLPVDKAFHIRRRSIDVATAMAFSIALLVLGLTTPLG